MLALVGGAVWALRGQLPSVLALAGRVHPRWGYISVACVLVLAAYLLLIDGWRRVLAALGGALTLGESARIWFTSNLARWLPGAFWQLGAMTEMTRRRGVPVTVSTASAMLITIVNLFTGFAVAGVLAGATLRDRLGAKSWWFFGLGAAALLLAPVVTPRLAALARTLSGRELAMPRFGLRPILIAAATTSIAWLAYGVAFWMMTRAILPDVPRSLAGCIALYTLSYLTGLLNPAPAGLGAAEGAMVILAPQLGVATQAEAAVLSVVVRIWRTVLEVLPGLIALAIPIRDREGDVDQPSRGSRIP